MFSRTFLISNGMKVTELRTKSSKELQRMLVNLKEKTRNLRFLLASGKVKNVREIRATKKEIATILTVLREKQN